MQGSNTHKVHYHFASNNESTSRHLNVQKLGSVLKNYSTPKRCDNMQRITNFGTRK